MKIDLNFPVESLGCIVKTSSTSGDIFVMFKLLNLSDRMIESVKFDLICYDAYGGEIAHVPVFMTGAEAAPHTVFAENKAVSIVSYPNTKRAVIEFHEVTFQDGETVTANNTFDVPITEPDPQTLARLKQLTFQEARCLAQQHEAYWLCVCGRANLPEAETCVRCGLSRDVVLSRYTSPESVEAAAAVMEQEAAEAEARARQAAAEEAMRRKQRNKKRLRLFLTVAVIVIAVAIAGFLGFRGICLLLGNSSAAKEDDLAAYRYYQLAGSRKMYDVQEGAAGNSAANILSYGFATEDDTYLYALDDSFTIYRQPLTGGEKESLGIKGMYLNVVGDWVYYINMDDTTPDDYNKIFRMQKDGSEKTKISDDPAVNLYVVADDLYFISLDEQNANMTQVFTMKADGSGKKQLSTNGAARFILYKEYIYYVGTSGGVYRVTSSGKEETLLQEANAIFLDAYDDTLYYVDGSVADQVSGTPKLPLMQMGLDGSNPTAVRDDIQVYCFDATDDGIYFADMSNMLPIKRMDFDGTGEAQLIDPIIIAFNVTENYLYCLNNETGSFQLMTKDGTLEQVVGTVDGASASADTAAPSASPSASPAQ